MCAVRIFKLSVKVLRCHILEKCAAPVLGVEVTVVVVVVVWVVYWANLLVSRRYGVGRRMNKSMLDWWSGSCLPDFMASHPRRQ